MFRVAASERSCSLDYESADDMEVGTTGSGALGAIEPEPPPMDLPLPENELKLGAEGSEEDGCPGIGNPLLLLCEVGRISPAIPSPVLAKLGFSDQFLKGNFASHSAALGTDI